MNLEPIKTVISDLRMKAYFIKIGIRTESLEDILFIEPLRIILNVVLTRSLDIQPRFGDLKVMRILVLSQTCMRARMIFEFSQQPITLAGVQERPI